MDQAVDIAEEIVGERGSATNDLLQGSDPNLGLTVVDNLSSMAVSDEEIAAVEAFLGLQAAMILKENNRSRSKAI